MFADIVVAFELGVVAAGGVGRGRCIVEERVGIAVVGEVAHRRHCCSSGLDLCLLRFSTWTLERLRQTSQP